MKKIYLLGLASMVALGVNAQTTLKVKSPLKGKNTRLEVAKKKKGANAAKLVNGPNSVNAMAGTVVCNTNYVAGTTMDINFVLTVTNSDAEYGDGFSMTFPAGITVNSTTNMPNIGPDDGSAYSDGPEAFNGITGQTISWGNDDNYYGGIVPIGDPNGPGTYPITINITIPMGTTGPLSVQFHLDGDQYTAPADLDGTVDINEQLSANVKLLEAALLQTQNQSACGLTTDNLAFFVKNDGSSAITVPTVGDSVHFSVNGTPNNVAVLPGQCAVLSYPAATPITSIAPGDTAVVVVIAPIDLSTAGTTYNITGMIDFEGSGDGNATDDVMTPINITNFAPHDATAAPYVLGFEPGETLFDAWTFPTANVATWSAYNQFFHSGTQALVKFGTASDDDWAISGCIDMVGGNQYDLSFWLKYYDITSAPDMSVYYGVTPDAAGMTNLVSANPIALPADTTYQQHTFSITPATSGTYYIGFHAVSASGSSGIMIDDINLTYMPVGIKENKLATDVVAVFPNPSAGVFTVKAVEASTVEVYSIIGENVYTSKLVKGNNTVDLSNVAAGTYVVKVKSGSNVISKRVVVNK